MLGWQGDGDEAEETELEGYLQLLTYKAMLHHSLAQYIPEFVDMCVGHVCRACVQACVYETCV